MNETLKAKWRAAFIEALQGVTDKLCEDDTPDDFWWADNTVPRMADAALNVMVAMAEGFTAKANGG